MPADVIKWLNLGLYEMKEKINKFKIDCFQNVGQLYLTNLLSVTASDIFAE